MGEGGAEGEDGGFVGGGFFLSELAGEEEGFGADVGGEAAGDGDDAVFGRWWWFRGGGGEVERLEGENGDEGAGHGKLEVRS